MSDSHLKFPKEFVWGAATAAYQIEGAWNAHGKGESIWDRFSHTKGKIATGETGDVACDHYNRYKEDVALMRQIGLQAYRFSIAWTRIFPEGKGRPNRDGIDFYSRLIDELLKNDIEPWITLYHWDLPQALQDKGGWTNRDTAEYFGEYAMQLCAVLGDRAKNWITINEPWIAAFHGHKTGEHAPGLTDEKAALQAGHVLLLGHARALQAIKASDATARVGIAPNLSPCYAESLHESEEEQAVAERIWEKEARWFLDPLLKGHYPERAWFEYGSRVPGVTEADLVDISQPLDFLGVNYYFRLVVGKDGLVARVPGSAYTDMGWEVNPTAFKNVLLRLKDEYANLPPIYITENGAAFPDTLKNDTVDDIERTQFLSGYVRGMHEAMEAGVPLKGYFVWSLLDNFEWACGTAKRFGIIHVDYETQRRTIKSSARWYTRLIEEGWSEAPHTVPSSRRTSAVK